MAWLRTPVSASQSSAFRYNRRVWFALFGFLCGCLLLGEWVVDPVAALPRLRESVVPSLPSLRAFACQGFSLKSLLTERSSHNRNGLRTQAPSQGARIDLPATALTAVWIWSAG